MTGVSDDEVVVGVSVVGVTSARGVASTGGESNWKSFFGEN